MHDTDCLAATPSSAASSSSFKNLTLPRGSLSSSRSGQRRSLGTNLEARAQFHAERSADRYLLVVAGPRSRLSFSRASRNLSPLKSSAFSAPCSPTRRAGGADHRTCAVSSSRGRREIRAVRTVSTATSRRTLAPRFFCSRSSSPVVDAHSAAARFVGNVFAAGAKPAMRTVAVKVVEPSRLLYRRK
jgi:hypothetical protein